MLQEKARLYIYNSVNFRYSEIYFRNIYILLILIILLFLLILLIKMKVQFVGKAKLTKQGQLTLPFEARQELKIKTDDELYWYLVNDHLVVVKELLNPKDLEIMLNKNKKSIIKNTYKKRIDKK